MYLSTVTETCNGRSNSLAKLGRISKVFVSIINPHQCRSGVDRRFKGIRRPSNSIATSKLTLVFGDNKRKINGGRCYQIDITNGRDY